MRYKKEPLHNLLWSATTATFSSKGHMTLLLSRFESTENPKEMVFLTNESTNKAELNILSARDTTRPEALGPRP